MHKKDYPLIRFIFLNRKSNLIVFASTCVLLFILVMFVIPLEYTSQLSIIPSAANFSQGLAGKLGSLSKIAGLDLPGSSAQSQEMYKGILSSRRLLDQIIYHTYTFIEDDSLVQENLITHFEIEEETKREIEEKILKKMREDVVAVNIDVENQILYLDVTTENAFLSAQVANKMVKILNEIVKTEVQKEFRLKQEYLENRLTDINDSLKIAENDLKFFLEMNTDPTTPNFQIEQIRLQRNLQIQTELLIEFRKQLEIFIADNILNLSDIKILDDAYPSYRKSRPKRALLLIALGILVAFLQIGVNGIIYIVREISPTIINQEMNE
jgi:uncharacterized protein involved in exopolysaccharide biosynthesis